LSSAEEPQVSWTVVEAGTSVITSDGEEAASVSRVVGDPDADIFTGLAVKSGLLGTERFVPSEQVTGIWPSRVQVALARDELESLPAYEDAPVVRIEPESPGFFRRLFGR
jgi:hypothetical protein